MVDIHYQKVSVINFPSTFTMFAGHSKALTTPHHLQCIPQAI